MEPSRNPSPRSRGSRALAVLLVVLATALALPGTAFAAPPVQTVESVWGSRPGAITTADGTLDFHVLYSDRPHLVASMSYGGRLGTFVGFERSVSLEGNRLSGDLWVIDADSGELAGIATYVLDFTEVASPTTDEEVRREGNRQSRLATTRQQMTVDGTFTLPDGTTFPIVGAPGQHAVYELWSNAPAATVEDGRQTFVRATWLVGEREVSLVVAESAIAAEVVVNVFTPGHGEIVGHVNRFFDDDRLVAELDLQRADLSVAGTAMVEIAVRATGSSWTFEQNEFERLRVITEEIVATGMLTLEVDGETYDLSLADADVSTHRSSWHGIRYPNAGDEPQG